MPPSGASFHESNTIPPSAFQAKKIESSLENSFSTVRKPFDWERFILLFWMGLSCFLGIRLIISLAKEWLVLRKTELVKDKNIYQPLDAAVARLGLKHSPAVLQSESIHCPVICCWGWRPALVLPKSVLRLGDKKNLTGILCHELAHWKRKDHYASLLAELAVCFLPWQPLLWWMKQRLERFSELACDHWVLSTGESGEEYAESLLDMLPQRRQVFSLAVVNRRKRLEDRIRAILRGWRAAPNQGALWTMIAILLSLGLTAAVAFAQSGNATRLLDAVGIVSSPDSLNDNPIPMSSARRINIPDIMTVSNLSPDGKYFACFLNYDLMTYNIETGEIDKIDEYVYPQRAVWSQDGNRLAYTKIRDREDMNSFYLAITDLSAKKEEKVLELKDYYFNIEDWSSDGKYVVGTEDTNKRKHDNHVIVAVNLERKELTYLETNHNHRDPTWYSELNPRFSPDGKYIVYRTSDYRTGLSTLHIRTLDDAYHYEYSDYRGNIEFPFWSPDGRFIIFRGKNADQTLDIDIYAIQAVNGQFLGIPIRVLNNFGRSLPITWTRNNKFAYNTLQGAADWGLYVFSIDANTGHAAKTPKRIFSRGTRTYAWYADSAKILHPYWDGMQIFSLQDLKLESIRPEIVGAFSHIQSMSISPDNSFIVMGASDAEKNKGVFKMQLDTGEIDALVPMNVKDRWGLVHVTRLTADGSAIAYVADNKIYRLSLADRKTDMIAEGDESKGIYISYAMLSLTSDGTKIAYNLIDNERNVVSIIVKSFPSNETKEIVSYSINEDWIYSLDLSPDGGNIAYLTDKLWIAPLSGKEPYAVELPEQLSFNYLSRIQWSPDGKQISVIAKEEHKPQYWIIDNFVIEGKKEQAADDVKPVVAPKSLKGANVVLLSTPDKDKYPALKQDIDINKPNLQEGKEGYAITQNGLKNGEMPFTDRSCKLDQIPSELEGLTLLHTAMAHKQVWDDEFVIKLSCEKPFCAFIAVDERALELWKQVGTPKWLREYSPTEFKITTDDSDMKASNQGYKVFFKKMEAGTIVLGPPRAGSTYGTMYIAFFGVESKD
ncbi:MAG: M56 family metallopeptidase [Candidatus Omnitrophota bacterium]